MSIPNEQELFWAGSFGDEYTERSSAPIESLQPFFKTILELAPGIRDVCELGANKGLNLLALQRLDRSLRLTGIEVNPVAFNELSRQTGIKAIKTSIQDYSPEQGFDLVFTCGVLIHLNPADLPATYGKIGHLSRRYVLLNEYFNPTPLEVPYREFQGKLFKRDFAGEFLDATKGKYSVVRYGFLWKRLEPAWDNTTWTLFRSESTNSS